MNPKRGEIYLVDFNPARGSEQAGVRPALIVQNDRGNQSAPTTVVAVITTTSPRKPYPFMVALAAGEGGLDYASCVNCAQLMTVAKDRLGKRLGALDEKRVQQVADALRFEFDL